MFENRVLRIFGPKRGAVSGEWKKLHNEELNDIYSSPNVIWVIKSRRMRTAGHAARMVRADVYTGFRCGNLWKRPLGRLGRRREDNNVTDLQVGWE